MHFRQFYLGCLAHASYLIGANGEAAVVDPQRDVDIYLDEAKANGLVIKHVIETHLHADFVSGHHELAARTGARIYFGYKAPAKFEFVPVRERDEIVMGDVTLRFIETPGHTPESISVLILDGGRADGVLTGDALFIGDVGRPDLLGSRMPATELAGMLFDSLHEKLLTLPDEVKVYPAHGAGSMCGRNISNEKSSTIGNERRFNYALQPMSRAEFIQIMTTDLPEPPSYFSKDAQINLQGPQLLEELAAPQALKPLEVEERQKQGALILDTRPAAQYGNGHVPGSLNVSLCGQFATWAGSLIALETPIVVVAEDDEQIREAQTRLARVGIDKVVGYLAGGILSWHQAGLALASIEQISVDELRDRLAEHSLDMLIDVRRPAEWVEGHIDGATTMPLNHLAETAAALDRHKKVGVICAGGFRSSIGSSLLERQGFTKISNVVGGMGAWKLKN